MIYQKPSPEEPLSQGDLIDHCPILFWETVGPETTGLLPATVRVRIVVLTQACDLIQAKSERVLVAVVHNAQQLVDRGILKSNTIREQIRSHRVYGWYFLPAGEAIRESLIDLRDLRPVLAQLAKDGKRICRITTPYREHLAQHFAITYSRIGLPLPYETETAS